MLAERLRNQWRAREGATPLYPAMVFKAGGLMLGAETVLAVPSRQGHRTDDAPENLDARLLTLLSAAYDRPVGASVLGHIRRAMERWGEGEEGLAAIHLSLTGLQSLPRPHQGAHRLFLADGLMRAGIEPAVVLRALGIDGEGVDSVSKYYNPAQPRVPAGSGLTSGRWTQILGAALDVLSSEQVKALALFAARATLRVGGPAAVLGLLFIPPSNNVKVRGDAPGFRGLSYSWNRDETNLILTYKPDVFGAATVVVAKLSNGDIFRDHRGRAIGRVMPSGIVVVDPAAAFDAIALKNQPNLCPAPGADKYGRGEANPKDRDYEDFVKRLVNPGNPTPRGLGVRLPYAPARDGFVYYDDCQHDTGIMIEAKGTGYANIIRKKNRFVYEGVTGDWLKQSYSQIAASNGRPVQWYFAEDISAEEARKLFVEEGGGRENIQIFVLRWKEAGR